MTVTDKILSRYGMTMHMNPYRIINKNGIIVQKNRLDLRPEVLKDQENRGFLRPLFVRTSPSTL